MDSGKKVRFATAEKISLHLPSDSKKTKFITVEVNTYFSHDLSRQI